MGDDMTEVLINHADGIPWFQAKMPSRWHRCRAQTFGWHRFMQIDRCACGAIRLGGRIWMERNSRRKRMA